MIKNCHEIGHDMIDLISSSEQPLEEIKYLLRILKQSAFRVLDTETIMLEMQIEEIEIGCNEK